jgi:L-lactate dehydrogenase complex protein LldG
MTNSHSRDDILARVRSGSGYDLAQAAARRQAALDFLAQHSHGPRPLLADDLVPRFCRRSAAMSSTVDHVAQIADVPAAIARYLAAGDLPKQAVCWQELGDLPWASVGLSVEARAARGDDLVSQALSAPLPKPAR